MEIGAKFDWVKVEIGKNLTEFFQTIHEKSVKFEKSDWKSFRTKKKVQLLTLEHQ